MSDTFIDQFNAECHGYLKSELNTRLLSLLSATDKSTASEYYFAEYQRCLNEQMNFINYITEQQASLDTLKSCETTIDAFLERLKAVHQYELKQNDLFEQILNELTTMNPSGKTERLRLLEQIDDLIAEKAKLAGSMNDTNPSPMKLAAKSSDTFKNIFIAFQQKKNVCNEFIVDECEMGVFRQYYFLSKPILICATTGLLWARFNQESDAYKEELKKTIDNVDLLCQAYKEKQGIPGVSIGVTMHGSAVWKKGFGLADIEQRVPCTSDTVMRIASISKTFTTAIAAQFVEKGKLNWDDTIDKHHRELPKFLYDNVLVSITIRQLATHTSGIRHYWKKGEVETDDEFVLPEYYLTRSYPTVSEALSIFLHDELLHQPGSSWRYTTHGYTLLSAVLECISDGKQAFPTLLQDLIIRPLDLRHTKLEYPDEIVPNRSRYYCRRTLKEGLRNVAYVDLSYKWAGGGMLSNVNDLLVYANTLLQCYQTKSTRSESTQLFLKAETIAEMWSPIAVTNDKNTFYGLGWMISKERTSAVHEDAIPFHVYHTGGAVGATSVLLIIPCTKKCSNPRCGICVVILANLQSARGIYQTALDIALLFRQISPCSSKYKQ
ncbi:unnamed protein product [Adineta ricciae]|uniref:Beta-lactamase-related domain-containing protein n=1 Tax=Adineta ricciae TaxID=249248 RepID=A0A813Y5P5_ADIRI|nr:unnamed protein product [Adineta ricciae]